MNREVRLYVLHQLQVRRLDQVPAFCSSTLPSCEECHQLSRVVTVVCHLQVLSSSILRWETWWLSYPKLQGAKNNSHNNVHSSVNTIGARELHNRESNVRVSRENNDSKSSMIGIMVEDFQNNSIHHGETSQNSCQHLECLNNQPHIKIKSKLTFQRKAD